MPAFNTEVVSAQCRKPLTLPPRAHDLTGFRSGRLVALSIAERYRFGGYYWHCQCDCGARTKVLSSILKRMSTKSCGCLQSELAGAALRTRATIHGKSKTSLFSVWQGMHSRCKNPANKHFKDYGARGINVCQEWSSFEAFAADMGDRPNGRSIDRIDNSAGYSKVNCRWASSAEQSRNTRRSVHLTYGGRTMCLEDWATKTGISQGTLWSRLNESKWSIEKTLTAPVGRWAQ